MSVGGELFEAIVRGETYDERDAAEVAEGVEYNFANYYYAADDTHFAQ